MTDSVTDHIEFQVETSRILEILSSEIYDSPYALMRENLQNAYDAVLMRCEYKKIPLSNCSIDISIEDNRLVITDDGIGMDEKVLRENFWKAGSSGKRTELAKKSGVIGTFGIGAMANFGVCTKLIVETRHVDSEETLISTAERDNLSIAKECISLSKVRDERDFGTTLIAEFDPESPIDIKNARSYLEPYVKFLPMSVKFNGDIISQNSFIDGMDLDGGKYTKIADRDICYSIYSCHLETFIDKSGDILARISNVSLDKQAINGNAIFIQKGGQLFGLRNFFGLAPIPIGGNYQFGGFVNFSFLHPTAGREALSRESIKHVNSLITMIEKEVSVDLSSTTSANVNVSFMNYIHANRRFDLAGKITIKILPDDREITIDEISGIISKKNTHYYQGRDVEILKTFASIESNLLHTVQNNPKRNIQIQCLVSNKVKPVPDSATVTKEYSPSDLSFAEGAFVIKTAGTLSDDYMLSNVEIVFAEITHGVPVLVKNDNDTVFVILKRNSGLIQPVLETYTTAYEVFGGFIKDFVRNHLYPRLSQFVPSSTREGADALQRILKKNKELYRYDDSDLGDIGALLEDYISGAISFNEIIKSSKSKMKAQTQTVQPKNVGNLESVIPDVVTSPVQPDANIEVNVYSPMPSILRNDVEIKMKVLTTEAQHSQLNNFRLFLGLSDRLFKREKDFFLQPHTTKVIWGGHRVVYIFTDPTGRVNLYYDIELKIALDDTNSGGAMFPTTTIVTKNRIFVPLPPELESAFEPNDGVREFYVRFDLL